MVTDLTFFLLLFLHLVHFFNHFHFLLQMTAFIKKKQNRSLITITGNLHVLLATLCYSLVSKWAGMIQHLWHL